MKKCLTLCLCLAALLCLIFITTPEANAATYGDLTYSVSGGKATITSCKTSATGAITIPAALGGYPVTTIGDLAFYNHTSLTSVTIGSRVTTIGESAFSGCTSLQNVTIGSSVTTIGDFAFHKCTSLQNVTVGNSVTTIGSSAFSGCTSLTSITIPDSVTTIGSSAFSSCTSLTSITIPDSVTTIGSSAFYDCDSLTSVTIGDSVTTIDIYAFSRCTSLTSVTIGDSVTSIGDWAFQYCDSLTSVTIPDSVAVVGTSAFLDCDGLTNVYITDPNAWCKIRFSNSLANPLYYADNGHVLDAGGNELSELVLDASVTSIPSNAFRNCNRLTSITIPDSVTTIGSSAFSYCTSLTSVTIGDSVTTFDNYAFSGCTSLQNVTIGDSVTTIGNYAFYDCDSLTSITIPDSVTSIGDGVFLSCYNLTSVTIPDSVTTIGNGAFSSCNSLTSITIPNSVTTIDYGAFAYCTSLTSVTIPDSVTTIARSMFDSCSRLTSITIPVSVTSIGNWAFDSCTSLTDVYYTGTQTQWESIQIGDENTCLTGATIHYNWHEHVFTTYVSNNDASYLEDGTKTAKCDFCDATETIVDVGSKLPSVANGTCGQNLTWWLAEGGTLTILGTGAMTDYKYNSSVPWYTYESSIKTVTITQGVARIGSSAFSGCYNLTSVTIGDSVKSIGDQAFYWCTRLTSVTIPDSVISIGVYAFYGCTRLTSVTIGDSVTTIGNLAFADCTSLTSVTIGDSVTSIGSTAFSDCTSLTNITIPDSVTSIGSTAFSDCTSLTNITIPDSVTSIGNNAFQNCTSLTSITIPDSVITIGRSAFLNCNGLANVYITDPNTWCKTSFGDPYANPLYYADNGHILDADGNELTGLVLDSSVTAIRSYAFRNCNSLTSVTIPDSVTAIYNDAFSGCTSLTSITIPDSVTTISSYAFSGCASLKDVYYTGTQAQWSAINIGGSNTYLTDATIHYNCHEHVFTNYAFDNNATCVADGTKTAKCEKCDLTDTLPATGTATGIHSFTNYVSNNDATCLTDGTKTATCDQCSVTDTVTDIGSALGHSFTYVSNNDATCTADGTKTAKCDRCFVTDTLIEEGTALGHSFTNYVSNNDATCTADGTKTSKCDRCDVTDTLTEEGTALGHSFTNYVSNNDATCTADGTKTAKCDRCDATDTIADTGSALGHQWDEGVYYPPTSKKEGYTHYTCFVCGETKDVVDTPPGEILAQPASITAETGDTAQFRVETQGEVVSYKWQYRKIYKWFDTTMEGYNTDSLTVPATGARNGYDYRCVITFADGTVLTTEPAELTVNTYITGIGNPNDQTVVLGYKGQFTAAATGEGLQYRWYYMRPDGTKWLETAMEGYNRPTVYIESTTARDGYKYRCQITDVTGKVVYTEPATMRVLSFTAQPAADVFAGLNENVQITVSTSVPDGFTYQWQYRRSESGSWTNTTMTGYNTATLTVATTKDRNGYQYRCVLTGSKSSKLESKVTTLHCGDATVIEDQSLDCTVQAGKTVQIMVAATNVYTYQWQYAKAGSDEWHTTTMEGNTTAALKVQATAARNGYRYRCIIKGLDGTEIISEPVTLTVK